MIFHTLGTASGDLIPDAPIAYRHLDIERVITQAEIDKVSALIGKVYLIKVQTVILSSKRRTGEL
jgi:hypothetical protein